MLNESANCWQCDEDQLQQPLPDKVTVDLHGFFDKETAMWEENPLMGIRGCRTALLWPAFLRMQTRAILMAGCSNMKDGKQLNALDIIIPSLTSEHELVEVLSIIHNSAKEVSAQIM